MNTIKKNTYRMLILAGIALLVLVNLSQSAFAEELKRPNSRDCIKVDRGKNDDDLTVVYKLTNTCKESWTVKYFHARSEPNTPYEQVLKPGESFLVHRKAGDYEYHSFFEGTACPSTDETLLEVDSLDALIRFQCAWR